MSKDELFLDEDVSEKVKFEIKLLYDIGVEIKDIEFFLDTKSRRVD